MYIYSPLSFVDSITEWAKDVVCVLFAILRVVYLNRFFTNGFQFFQTHTLWNLTLWPMEVIRTLPNVKVNSAS